MTAESGRKVWPAKPQRARPTQTEGADADGEKALVATEEKRKRRRGGSARKSLKKAPGFVPNSKKGNFRDSPGGGGGGGPRPKKPGPNLCDLRKKLKLVARKT